ncbi:uncharacterized protein G2W53_041109 [Senna tora]|uniref:Uncharacterized protein n=1 Tax=Senna tora TaxID=362788 RepID=A0A834SEA3_9FABA|nr:uncharacterized protein G2W53_041109 [Senna tora]
MAMHGVGGEGKQVEGIVGMFKVKASMAFWYTGNGDRYGTFKEEGKFYAVKADVFRVMGIGLLRWVVRDVGSSGTSFPHTLLS